MKSVLLYSKNLEYAFLLIWNIKLLPLCVCVALIFSHWKQVARHSAICNSKFITYTYKSTKSINMEYKMFIENTNSKDLEKHSYKTILYRIWNI